jgi:hypothetical protein
MKLLQLFYILKIVLNSKYFIYFLKMSKKLIILYILSLLFNIIYTNDKLKGIYLLISKKFELKLVLDILVHFKRIENQLT